MSNNKLKIKKGDTVLVIAGSSKNKKGEVLQVFPKDARVLVRGVNLAKKHQKPSADSPGGIIEKELSIHISNVAFLDPKESKATRIGYKIEDNKKVRFAKLSKTVIK